MEEKISWPERFWNTHGERLTFLFLAVSMASAFWFLPDMRETAKTVLIGCAMLLYNKTRSGDNK